MDVANDDSVGAVASTKLLLLLLLLLLLRTKTTTSHISHLLPIFMGPGRKFKCCQRAGRKEEDREPGLIKAPAKSIN